VREDAEDLLLVLVRALPGGEGIPEAPLVAREHALDVLPPVIDAPREARAQGAPIAGLGSAAAVALVQPDHRLRDAELLAADDVVRLPVEARVGDHRAEPQQPDRLRDDRRQRPRVARRAPGGERPGDQMRRRVDGDGQLRMLRPAVAPLRPAAAVELGVGRLVAGRVAVGVVRADVMRREPRGIDGRRRAARGEKPPRAGTREDDPLGAGEGPPFSAPTRRRWAA
jgi:hypothetical protein